MFSQITYEPLGKVVHWDNTDIRYAKTGIIDGTNVVYGITANNNPTVQDAWNSTPAWGFPYIGSRQWHRDRLSARCWEPANTAQGVGGVGGYVWIDRSIYAEFTAYGNLSQRALTDLWLAASTVPLARFDGMAPYWRLAYEKTWDKNSLMFGTFGMYAEQKMGVGLYGGGVRSQQPRLIVRSGVSDPTLDIGIDAQYQWIGDVHAVTVRGHTSGRGRRTLPRTRR